MDNCFKFGVEIEINALDGRDFTSHPLFSGEDPEGISFVASMIGNLGLECEIRSWGYNHDNKVWICKPDSSCGIEVCSPVYESRDFSEISMVLDAMALEPRIQTDDRCSLHVHVEIPNSEMFGIELASVLAWWIKCEHIFLDSFPSSRKVNKYCRCIGMTSLFDDFEVVSPAILVKKLSEKYLSLNTFHLFNKRRKSIEFRLCEGTKNSKIAEGWISTVLHFVEKSLSNGLPDDYRWLELSEFFDFMFDKPSNIKEWFLERIFSNCKSGPAGSFSTPARRHIFENCEATFGQTTSFIECLRDK